MVTIPVTPNDTSSRCIKSKKTTKSVLPIDLVEIALRKAISVISAELDGCQGPGLALAAVGTVTRRTELV